MINTLTSFRFFAALLVFVWHLPLLSILSRYQLGYLGVSFFYLLSGFILTHVYASKINKLISMQTFNFLIARFAKIYPVHILTMLIAIPIAIHFNYYQTSYQWISVFMTNLLLIQSWFQDPLIHFGLNGLAWSISVEIFFYVCLPFVLLIMHKKNRYFKSAKILAYIIIFWILAYIFLYNQNARLNEWQYYILPIARIPEFITGVLLYKLFKENKNLKFIINKKPGLLETSAIFLVTFTVILGTYIPQPLRFSALYLPSLSFLIYVFAHQSGYLSKILSKRPFVFLGEISFSFYMIHLLVINYMKIFHPLNYMLSILAFLITIILSSICYLYYEEPIRKTIRKLLIKI